MELNDNTTWYHLVPPGTTWYHLVPPGTTWHHLVPPGTTWYHFKFVLLAHLKTFRITWHSTTWCHMASPGATWYHLGPPSTILCHPRPSQFLIEHSNQLVLYSMIHLRTLRHLEHCSRALGLFSLFSLGHDYQQWDLFCTFFERSENSEFISWVHSCSVFLSSISCSAKPHLKGCYWQKGMVRKLWGLVSLQILPKKIATQLKHCKSLPEAPRIQTNWPTMTITVKIDFMENGWFYRAYEIRDPLSHINCKYNYCYLGKLILKIR